MTESMTLFGSIFPIFWAKNIFPENPALSCTTSYEFLAPCQNLEKINVTIPRKCLDKRKDGWNDRGTDRPYFIGPFRLPPRVQQYLSDDMTLIRSRLITFFLPQLIASTNNFNA